MLKNLPVIPLYVAVVLLGCALQIPYVIRHYRRRYSLRNIT